MKVIIAGSRGIVDYQQVRAAMEMADLVLGIRPTQVVSGKARGVDTLGERWAHRYRIPVKGFPAAWRTPDGELDRGAGHRRNEEMAAYADALVAVWNGTSPGTADMIRRAESHGLLVWVHQT